MAVERDFSPHSNRLTAILIGPPKYSRTRLLLAAGLSLAAGVGAAVGAREQVRAHIATLT
jgi:hypothetical protein